MLSNTIDSEQIQQIKNSTDGKLNEERLTLGGF